MKFLETPELASLNDALSTGIDLGAVVVRGTLTAWSCKLAGTDKKLSASIEQEVVSSLAESPASLSSSPIGPLTDSGSRKTLIYLILTLNHLFPDYDFSGLRANHFSKEEGLERARGLVQERLLDPARMFGGFASAPELETLWPRLDEVISPADCDVYSYKPDTEGDPFAEEGALWSINYFFFNRKLKRIVCFTCLGARKRVDAEPSQGEALEDDGFFEMDEA